MSVFNNYSRTKNALRISAVGVITNILKALFGFGYRRIFLIVLSEVYLGINGLFISILQILSLAELGVTTAIIFRFYEPISRDDVHYVGMLMNFFKRVYLVIAVIILAFGILIMPFIGYLLNDASEVPGDVNLYIVYGLFLANTLSTYLFSYKLTLLTADQKNDVTSVINLIITFITYVVQITVLFVTKNYTLTLAIGTCSILLVNYISSLWVKTKYGEVFRVKEMLPKEERKKIFTDMRSCMYHKVGTTVLTGTDNVVLSKMVSLTATGLYSNYAMIIIQIQNIIGQSLGNFTASVGNARQNIKKEEYYSLYRKMNFAGLWISCVVTVCLYLTIDDFIYIWLGEKFLFDQLTTIVLCVQMYLTISRTTNGAFINADGLFVKDKIRPLIESVLNLILSIILASKFGIVGVFLGTIISSMVTVCIREPLLLYRYSFSRSVWEYWIVYLEFFIVTTVSIILITLLKKNCWHSTPTWLSIIGKGCLSLILINSALIMLFSRTVEFKYFITNIRRVKKRLYIRRNKDRDLSNQ